MTLIRRINEVYALPTFEERFDYLCLGGTVGHSTFGHDRWMNQRFYTSREWKLVRDEVIVRDNGCDLGVPGREIYHHLIVHHINPMIPDDIIDGNEWIMNPDFLIVTSRDTHNAIHYGDRSLLTPTVVVQRLPGDTKLW